MVRRRRLSARSVGPEHPARRAHRVDRGRLRRDDKRSRISPRARPRGRDRRDRAVRGHAVRSRALRCICEIDRSLAPAHARARPRFAHPAVTMLARDTYCSFCGTKYAEPLVYPRTCPGCKTQVWANPIPVCVALVPIKTPDGTGLLTIRRAIPPGIGRLALVGGFLEEHERWQDGRSEERRVG